MILNTSHGVDTERPVACTIVAKNYLAHARCLTQSFLAQHPDGLMYVLLVDRVDGCFDPAAEQFLLLEVEELNIASLIDMTLRYDLLELCTAVKPFLLEFLLYTRGHRKICYLDPDIWVYRPLTEAWTLLDHHAIVLTPHLLGPLPDRSDPDELLILQCGTYNLGFIGISDHSDTRSLLAWWRNRMLWGSLSKIEAGHFVDQKWIDLTPGFYPSIAIIRHPGYNTAYWDLSNRAVTPDGNGEHSVNGMELVFFHFSGYDPRHPKRISKYQNRFTFGSHPQVRPLFDTYRDRLLEKGYETATQWANSLIDTGRGQRDQWGVRKLWRSIQLRSPTQWRLDPLLNLSKQRGLATWLCQPDATHPSTLGLLTPVMTTLYRDNPVLTVIFPDPAGADEIMFALWFIVRARRRHGIHRRFAAPVALRLVKVALRHPLRFIATLARFCRLGISISSGRNPHLEERSHLRL